MCVSFRVPELVKYDFLAWGLPEYPVHQHFGAVAHWGDCGDEGREVVAAPAKIGGVPRSKIEHQHKNDIHLESGHRVLEKRPERESPELANDGRQRQAEHPVEEARPRSGLKPKEPVGYQSREHGVEQEDEE